MVFMVNFESSDNQKKENFKLSKIPPLRWSLLKFWYKGFLTFLYMHMYFMKIRSHWIWLLCNLLFFLLTVYCEHFSMSVNTSYYHFTWLYSILLRGQKNIYLISLLVDSFIPPFIFWYYIQCWNKHFETESSIHSWVSMLTLAILKIKAKVIDATINITD